MRRLLIIAAVALLAALVLLHRMMAPLDLPRPRKGVPIGELADGKAAPQIGLLAPMPKWMPLPKKGLAVGAELYRPQPPYGASATVLIQLEESQDSFMTSYRKELDEEGFSVRPLPIPFNLVVDRPDAQYEADERKGGRAIYVTLRATHFAQLTFWDVPAPRM